MFFCHFVYFQYGLYSAFMGCILYVFFGTAKDITLGPTAIMSLMTESFARSPVKDDATYAILLCFMSGIIQLILGILHLGRLWHHVDFSRPLEEQNDGK